MKRKIQVPLDIFLIRKPIKQTMQQPSSTSSAVTDGPSCSGSRENNGSVSARRSSFSDSFLSSGKDVENCDIKLPDSVEILSQELAKKATTNVDSSVNSSQITAADANPPQRKTYGADFSKFKRNTGRFLTFEECKNRQDIVILLPDLSSEQYSDKWDSDFVRLPCSRHNLYQVSPSEGNTQTSRWKVIKDALSVPIRSSNDLEEAILTYNMRYAKNWNFRGLHSYLNEVMNESERRKFFDSTLPKMIQLALELPQICPKPIPLLKRRMNRTLILSQKQAGCLLANAFFCTFPRRNAAKSNNASAFGQQSTEYENYPRINFNNLFGPGRLCREKLKFLLHYFERITNKMPEGLLSFQRKCFNEFPDWNESNVELSNLHITAVGTIEDFGDGMLQVDFANKFLGGGVLSHGCVQEEIRFLINPELITSMLFTECMLPNEAVVITGCERFSCYMGYGSETLEWSAPFNDDTERDELGRIKTEIVAIDAVPFNSYPEGQFSPGNVIRELNKAFCGFHNPGEDKTTLSAVATGNWGCGAFGGDVQLKSLIQIMAAAQAGRDLVYFTFGDEEFAAALDNTYLTLKAKSATVGSIMIAIRRYYELEVKNRFNVSDRTPLFDYIKNNCK